MAGLARWGLKGITMKFLDRLFAAPGSARSAGGALADTPVERATLDPESMAEIDGAYKRAVERAKAELAMPFPYRIRRHNGSLHVERAAAALDGSARNFLTTLERRDALTRGIKAKQVWIKIRESANFGEAEAWLAEYVAAPAYREYNAAGLPVSFSA